MVKPNSNLPIPARLITIPVSHYCEKTRWALTRLQIPFVEERHMPPFHRFATRSIVKRMSSDDMSEAERNLSPINRFIGQQVGGQSVPVLITPAEILKDSDEILRYVDAIASEDQKLYPTNPEHRQQVENLVKSFNSVLGPAVRLWAYFYIMDRPDLLQPLWCQGVPWFERLLFPMAFPWMRSNVLQMYNISEASAIAAHESICKTFEIVENLLADGRTYLVGDQFSAADLTFATLAAAVVMPVGYGVKLPDISELPTAMETSIQQLRKTVSGEFVFRLYQERDAI
ncbi:MAG: glutathione S-transferase [Pseudanabaena sp.]|nr:MAG: glutathione S-transferase [Pseudanabaena sp.]